MSALVFNERSWAIDLISEINKIASGSTTSIKRASGESGLRTGTTTLFPDVILHGDAGILQGWELKLPDTNLHDTELLLNATDKAELLGTNSFLVWNGREAALWAKSKDDSTYKEIKTWLRAELTDRSLVEQKRAVWVSMLQEILRDLEFFLTQGVISQQVSTDVLDETFASRLVEALYEPDAAALSESAVKDEVLRRKISEWAIDNEIEPEERFTELAKLNILAWVNRFVFCHYLSRYNPVALKVQSIQPEASVKDVQLVFQEISSAMDFANVFVEGLGDEVISRRGWQGRLEFNNLLNESGVAGLPEGSMRSVLEEFTHASTRKSQGQFATPRKLALALSNLALNDLTGQAADPCCGSGTIAKSLYDTKVGQGVDRISALESIWASDKYQMPLQLTSMNLSDPLAIKSLVQVFRCNVFELDTGMSIELTDPEQPGVKVQKPFPKLKAIASNLPYVRQEILDARGPERVFNDLTGHKPKTFGKADLYAAIIFDLDRLLDVDGRIAVIVSNSWLGTKWGASFQDQIRKQYKVRAIIKSGNGRWFGNAKVVTTILVLEKMDEKPSAPINFVTTKRNLTDWDEPYFNAIKAAALMAVGNSEVEVNTVPDADLDNLREHGFYWRVNFFGSKTLEHLLPSTVRLSSYFGIGRGARTGQDDFYYPEKAALESIEKEYLVPFVKNSKELPTLMIESQNFAFSCDRSLDELAQLGHTGALNWIRKFENRVNGKGQSLVSVLEKQHQPWYYLSPKETGDFAMAMNPFESLAVYRAAEPVFMNQRLIKLNLVRGNPELIHALLNSAFGMLALEFLGFGRGEGVLDLRNDSVKDDMRMLDPDKVPLDKVAGIIDAFKPLTERPVFAVHKELVQQDRLNFERRVLDAYGLGNHLADLLELLKAGIEERIDASARRQKP